MTAPFGSREEAASGGTHDLRLLRRLWPFVRPHLGMVVLSMVMLPLVAAGNLLQPLVMGDVAVQADRADIAHLTRDGLVLAGLILLTRLLVFLQTYTMQIGGARAMADLRSRVFGHFQRLQLGYFDRTPVGQLVSTASNDVDAIGELFASNVLNALGDLTQLVGMVVIMLLLDWQLALFAFAALPVVGALMGFIRNRSRALVGEIREQTARLNSFLHEQVNGIRIVQALAREPVVAAEMEGLNGPYRDLSVKAAAYDSTLEAAIQMIGTLCVASILWWAGLRHVGSHVVTFALLLTFHQYLTQFFEPLGFLSRYYGILQGGLAGAERVFRLLDEDALEPAARPSAECGPDGVADEAIALEHVDFEYTPGVPVLRDVNLTARRGERIALVGATGAGKTTVAGLLLRHYEAQRGSVRVLGREVRSQPVSELRRCFSVVPQDVFLFTGTVLSNIALIDDVPDLARAERALARIGALELFQGREGGLNAPVDERGTNFSAGERQLLAFARALYQDAPLLLLDEATASVDHETEARLQAALDAVLEGRTALVIAHRLSTIRSADRIVVFHAGRVVEAGRHEELLALDGTYARLYRLQIAAQRDGAPVARTG